MAQFPDVPRFHGHDGLVEWLARMRELFETGRVELQEVEIVGDLVLTTERILARGRASGAQVDIRVFRLTTVRDGLIAAMRTFASREEALAAAQAHEPSRI